MSKDKFTLKKREMLLKAQKIIDKSSIGYVDILTEHVQKLEKSLVSDNISEAYYICNQIQSQAGTFGWPLASEISGWFKRLLKTQLESGVNSTVNELFLISLNTILTDDLKTDSHAAVMLLQNMEDVLKKENIR